MDNPYQTPRHENSQPVFEPDRINPARVRAALRWVNLATVAFSVSYVTMIIFIPVSSKYGEPNPIYEAARMFALITYLLGLAVSLFGLVRLLGGLRKSQLIMLLLIPLAMFPLANIIMLIHWNGVAKTAIENHDLQVQLLEKEAGKQT